MSAEKSGVAMLAAANDPITRAYAVTRKIRACEGAAAAQLVLEYFVMDAMRTAQAIERERCADFAANYDLGTVEGHAIADAIRAMKAQT